MSTSLPSARPTAADVARVSGVSRATVSYVLNETPGQTISEATRERVLRAADSLGYVPHEPARALARGRSDIVVIDQSDMPHGQLLAVVADAMAERFTARGYVPIVDQLRRASGDHSLLLALSATVAPAIVVTMTELPPDIRVRLERTGVRCVAAFTGDDARGAVDRLLARPARAQVSYLAAAGHRRLAFVPPFEPSLEAFGGAREVAVGDAAADHGLSVTRLAWEGNPERLTEQLRAAVDAGATAVVAYNDEVAFAVLAAAARGGLDVPGELAVIGVDDLPLARLTHPALTTVQQSMPGSADYGALVDRILADEPIGAMVNQGVRVVRRGTA